jgi:hypothetical protein
MRARLQAGIEMLPRGRRPAALAADMRHLRGVARKELVGRVLRRVRDVAVGVEADGQRFRVVAVVRRGLVKQLDEGLKALRHAADDRKRHRQAERAGADGRRRIAADRDPDRDLVRRARIDALVVERCAVLALPGDTFVVADAEQQLELFREQRVVVVEVVAEQRKRLDERAAPGHDLGAAVRQKIERGELLIDPDRIVGAQHGHRGG